MQAQGWSEGRAQNACAVRFGQSHADRTGTPSKKEEKPSDLEKGVSDLSFGLICQREEGAFETK